MHRNNFHTKRNVKISVSNINGFICKGVNKYQDGEFIETLVGYDIFCLQETHCDLNNSLELSEFPRPVHIIRSRLKDTGKRHGGVSVYIRNSIRTGIKFLNHTTNDFIWLKLCKDFFNNPHDIFLCFLYAPPENSTYSKRIDYDILELVEKDITKYSHQGKVIIAGDLNARTANENYYIVHDTSKHIPVSQNYVSDLAPVHRVSQDRTINNRGKQLLSLCIESGLRLLNGRSTGDLLGSFTCHQPLGSSAVDYIAVSVDILPLFSYIQVHKYYPELSDHCQVSCLLNCNYKTKSLVDCEHEVMPDKFIWDENSPELFTTALHSNKIQTLIDEFKSKSYNIDNINEAANNLNNLIVNAADISLKKKKVNKNKGKPKRKRLPKWYDLNLVQMKRDLNNKATLFQKNIFNPQERSSFFRTLKLFRKIRKRKKRQFNQEIINKLDNLFNKNPKEYWNLLDQLKNIDQKASKDTNIKLGEWKDYFKDLNSNKEDSTDNFISSKLEELKKSTIFNELYFFIDESEISKATSSLKNGKSGGLSPILNEMLKYGQSILLSLLSKLFNLVFTNGIYPTLWSKGCITPIHKTGSVYDASNYMGITISDNIGKLFNKILNNRVVNFLDKNNIISKEQIGFMKGCRTTDHMFTLQTLIQKYIKINSKPLYACFVDFKRAFDSVLHVGLLYKLKKAGVGDKFYNIIQSMYNNTETCVKSNNLRS